MLSQYYRIISNCHIIAESFPHLFMPHWLPYKPAIAAVVSGGARQYILDNTSGASRPKQKHNVFGGFSMG